MTSLTWGTSSEVDPVILSVARFHRYHVSEDSPFLVFIETISLDRQESRWISFRAAPAGGNAWHSWFF